MPTPHSNSTWATISSPTYIHVQVFSFLLQAPSSNVLLQAHPPPPHNLLHQSSCLGFCPNGSSSPLPSPHPQPMSSHSPGLFAQPIPTSLLSQLTIPHQQTILASSSLPHPSRPRQYPNFSSLSPGSKLLFFSQYSDQVTSSMAVSRGHHRSSMPFASRYSTTPKEATGSIAVKAQLWPCHPWCVIQ